MKLMCPKKIIRFGLIITGCATAPLYLSTFVETFFFGGRIWRNLDKDIYVDIYGANKEKNSRYLETFPHFFNALA